MPRIVQYFLKCKKVVFFFEVSDAAGLKNSIREGFLPNYPEYNNSSFQLRFATANTGLMFYHMASAGDRLLILASHQEI